MQHRSRRVRSTMGALALSALFAAGCGGDDGEETAKATDAKPAKQQEQLTQGEYLARADKVCLEASKIAGRANVAVSKAYAKKDPRAAAAALDRFGVPYGKKLQELNALKPPAGAPKELATFYQVMGAQVQALGLQAQAIRKGDEKKLAEIAQAQQDAVAATEELASGLGFKVCGRANPQAPAGE